MARSRSVSPLPASLDDVSQDRVSEHLLGVEKSRPATVSQQSFSETESHEISKAHDRPSLPTNSTILRRESSAIWTILLYFPFLVIPWILTAVLAYKPISGISYLDFTFTLSLDAVQSTKQTYSAVRILNAIGAILTLPVVSTLLAQAAVVFTQDSGTSSRSLSLQQTLPLANNAWSNVFFWSDCLSSGVLRIKSTLSRFLLGALALTVLVSIQQPLQQILVTTETITVPTCLDNPRGAASWSCAGVTGWGGANLLGYSPDPANFHTNASDLYTDYIRDKLVSFRRFDPQPNMWRESWNYSTLELPSSLNLDSGLWSDITTNLDQVYVTPFPNGTSTGVLRYNVPRLNTSMSCSNLSRSSFPAPCAGDLPFNASFNSNGLQVRVCAPGNFRRSPWATTNTSARWDITEELWVDVYLDTHNTPYDELPAGYEGNSKGPNATIHCVANSTMGYFELPNVHNDFKASQLLPAVQEFGPVGPSSFINNTGVLTRLTCPRECPTDVYSCHDVCQQTPGPLTASAIALFGDGSWFGNAAQGVINGTSSNLASFVDWQICTGNQKLPLTTSSLAAFLMGSYPNGKDINRCKPYGFADRYNSTASHLRWISYTVAEWMQKFAMDADSATDVLSASAFFANEAILTQPPATFDGRTVWTSPGTVVIKPVVSVAGLAVISTLIVLQVVLLVFLATYASRHPIWTPRLDALAMLRLGSKLHTEDLPIPGPKEEADMSALDRISGMVRFEPSTADGQLQPTLREGLTTKEIPKLSVKTWSL